jgi:RiboL-PSP-HEPN
LSPRSFFSWNDETAQPFFSGFGEACGKDFKARLKADDALKNEHDAFMRLGNLRNRVVHNDYAMYSLELTPAEVIGLYHLAVRFTERFEDLIFSQGSPQP